MNIFKTMFLLSVVLQISGEKFLKVFETENSETIRGITTDEPNLAIVAENFIMFGKVEDNYILAKINRTKLTKHLAGYSELLELKFITRDTVILCNYKECSVCINNGISNVSCTTLASFPIQSVNAQSFDVMLFLRVVHKTNNASIYSFNFDNGKYKKIGTRFDQTTDKNEFKSLYSFSRGDSIYFVSQIKRKHFDLCSTERDFSRLDSDIVITQICNNDHSDDIRSNMEITLACGEFIENINKSYVKNKTVYRDVHQNNVTGVAYLLNQEQLLLAIQDAPKFSFLCKFNISEIEKEFCETFNYCKSFSDPCDLCNSLKECNVKKKDIEECIKYSTQNKYSFCESLSEKSYCYARTNLTKSRKFKSAKSHVIVFGEILSSEALFTEVYGKLVPSKNQLFIVKDNKLLKRGNARYHFLEGLPNDNLTMITPWDLKNGIIYVDNITKNTIYFKDVVCNRPDCLDILHTTNVKCKICEKYQYLFQKPVCKSLEKTTNYCGPLWQKVDGSKYIVYVDPLVVLDTNDFLIDINGTEKYVQCVHVYNEEFQNCTNIIDEYLSPHFTNIYSRGDFPVTKNGTIVAMIFCVILLVACSIMITIIWVSRQKKNRLQKTECVIESHNLNSAYEDTLTNTETLSMLQDLGTEENIMEISDSENITFPYSILLQRPIRLCNFQVDAKRIVKIIKMLGSGNTGFVSLAEYRDENETKKVAVKTVYCSRSDIIEEIQALGSCMHDNIVTIIGWAEIGYKIRIITEYMSGGDLHSYISDRKRQLTISTIFRYTFQVLDAMIYLSGKHILHRDLAARNCLLDEDFVILKICDFGLSRKMDENYQYFPKSNRPLPFRWLSLEALKDSKFTVKGDIWSFGVLLWEIFERGNSPYNNLNFTDLITLLDSGGRLCRPPHCPKALYISMKRCWNKKPGSRPSFKILKAQIEDIFSHFTDDELHLSVP